MNHLTNGHQNGQASDEQIDSLYAYWPGLPSAPQPCPEALFSLTLKGKLDGIETLLTVRGMTAAEFKTHLSEVRGLLDQPQPAAQPASQGKDFCHVHQVVMRQTTKDGKSWLSHYDQATGKWCKGRG
jgi:hypothetical protein